MRKRGKKLKDFLDLMNNPFKLPHEYMRRAIELAKRGNTAPNPMVGAVLVKAGKTIAEGFSLICGWPPCRSGGLKKSG